ncbi:hypothetical protein ACHAXR_011114 [Thalassiosira sp. AJA248-18]
MKLTIITDALHGLPSRKKIQSERYYYTKNNLFEQSLDIYRPAAKDASDDSSLPIVALVVGSAWLGHRSLIYSQTSWWNSSGPKAVANLGYVCVCIRHRGAFMKTTSILTLAYILVVVAMMTALVNAVMNENWWGCIGDIFGERMLMGQAGGFLLALATGLILMEIGGFGAANFDEMKNDVMDALEWLHANESRLGLKRTTAIKGEIADAKSPRRLFVFGGYSSGGHVACAVTQHPELWKDRNLPPPQDHCDSILYISPVLSTKSYHDVLLKKISSLSSFSSLPSLTPSDGSALDQLSTHSSMSQLSSLSAKSPTWLTDQVVKAVFGHDAAHKIPSPIRTYEKSPPIPHLFLGCQEEMFGLSWLDTFFCSPSYSELLNSLGIESRYTAVESDHWNILNSSSLSDALRKELEWVKLECRKEKR